MDATVCSTHGPLDGKLVCPEIVEALRDRTPLPARADVHMGSEIGAALKMTLCGACIGEHGIPMDAAPIAEEDNAAIEALLETLDLVCPKCFAVAERELGTAR